jgi:hypothetical protein
VTHAPAVTKSVALVESPTQLVNALEWVHASGVGRARIVVLAPLDQHSVRQIEGVAARAASLDVHIDIAHVRRRSLAGVYALARVVAAGRGAQRVVVGDPFSGMIQSLLPLSRVRELVVVDDGTATWEFADCITDQRPLVRWRVAVVNPAGNGRATRATRRFTPSPQCSLTVFSCLSSGATVSGAAMQVNNYDWTRGSWCASIDSARTDIVGTSLVDTGVVDRSSYVGAVAELAAQFGALRYYAHRRESAAVLAEIRSLRDVEVVHSELPIELALTSGPVARHVITFPSTAAYTLPIVLAGSGVRIEVRRIEPSWFTPGTTEHAREFVTRIAVDAKLPDVAAIA